MKMLFEKLAIILVIMMGIVAGTGLSYGQSASSQLAPAFSLKDLKGQTFDLLQLKGNPMAILYFFDVDSRPSQEGLLSLNRLAKQYKGADLVVWAVTLSAREKVASFVSTTDLAFPVLLDGSAASDLYKARQVLPTVIILGPGLRVLDTFQGGGRTTEVMLVRLAERTLQRKQTVVAKAISDEVVKKNPQNAKAKALKGYAALKEEKLEEAEKTFGELSQKGGQEEILGKEGLTAVYARKGQSEKALQMASEVEQKAPERAYVHVVKADLLYAQGKKKEAGAEYQTALNKKVEEPYLETAKYNQAGRYYASLKQYPKARELYDHALSIDPYYIEGTTNKGITYEKEGNWDKALESYRQALALDKGDAFSAVLAKKAQEMIETQRDVKRKERIDQLVKDLVSRFRSQKDTMKKDEDRWTSPPMILTFVDFQERGGLAERDGFSTVLTAELSDYLNTSGRVRVVERVLMDRLLEELNIGSSDLANPETALKLGRLFAARLIGTGSLSYLPQGTLLSLRLIDTETSAVSHVITKQLAPQASLERELLQLNREILKGVIMKYPLRGYVVKVDGDQVMINLGSKQGVVLRTKFDVLEEQPPVNYKGKVLQASSKTVGQLEVTSVEPDLSFVRVLNKEKSLKADLKIQERIEERALP